MANDDGIIRIGTSVDISSLRSAMEQAADVMQSSSQSMADAMEAAKVASKNLADAQAQLGAAAAAGSEQAQAVIAEYQSMADAATAAARETTAFIGPLTRVDAAFEQLASATAEAAVTQANYRAALRDVVEGTTPYTLATQSLTASLRESFEATQALAAAKLELANATKIDTVAEDAQSEALAVNANYSRRATEAMYVLQGSSFGAARALGDFAGRIPIVGSVIEASFNAFVVVAFAEMAMRAGKAIYDAFDMGGVQALKFQQDLISVNNSFDTLIARTEVESDKLDANTAKLEGRISPNGIKQAMDEAVLAAAEMSDKLDSIIQKQESLLKSQIYNPSLFKDILTFTPQRGDHQEQVMLEQHQMWLERAKTVQDQLNESKSYGLALQTRFNDLLKIQSSTATPKYYANEVAALQTLIGEQQKEQAAIQATINLQNAQGNNIHAHAVHDAMEQMKRDQQQMLEAWRQATAQIDRETKSEADALAKVAKAAGPHSLPIFDSIARAISETANPEAQKNLAQMAETIAHASEATRNLKTETASLDDVRKQSEDDWIKINNAHVEATDIALKTANAQREASIRARESIHAITPLAAAYDIAKLHAKEYREQLAALNAQLDVQRQVGKDAEAAQTQNQISQLMGNRSVQQIQDQSMIQQQIAKPWLSAFDQINQGWLQVQNRMLFTTRNIGLEFAKMGQNLVIWGMDSAEKWLLGWAEKELLAVVLHHTTNAQKIASDQAASATQLATGVATNVSLAESYAAVAAAAAAASAAAIPITGWAIAPGAAAAIYASTSAYAAMAAFETGTGYVPRDGVAMLHEGEAVIPAPTVDELRGGDGGGSDLSITQNNHFHGFNPDREFKRQLHRNAADVAAALQRHLRQGGKL